ncbi:MAG TPA: S9 family peptidase [Acidobacteriota bacterium]|nr:S9 family peptidase [Acidobacteriota bacterium]
MCRKITAQLLLVVAILISASRIVFPADATAAPQPPVAAKKPHPRTIHGETVVDNYFWLREKSNPEVMAYLKAEDDYTEAMMKTTIPFQGKLYNEMLSHIKETDVNVPYLEDGYYYYSRTQEGKQYPTYCRKKSSLDAPEEIVLDQNALATGLKFLSIDIYQPSDDANLLAFSTDNTGYRQYTLQIKDLRTGKILPEKIERVDDMAWAADNKTIFYVTEDAVSKRNDKLWRHVIGTDKYDLIYDEKDEIFDIGVGKTRDKAVIIMEAASKTSTDVRFIPANDPSADWKVIVPRQPDHEYDVDHRGDQFYIRTNKNARNFRVMTAPQSDPSESNWKEFVAHRPAVKIEAIDLFQDYAVLSDLENGVDELEIIDLKTNEQHKIQLPEPVHTVYATANHEFNTSTLRYNYQSMVTPASIYDYDMKTREAKLLKQTEVPGGFDKANYKTERVYGHASDGTVIPISVVYRTNVKLDGSAPMLLYGYGSYGASITPDFSATRLVLLDRGVVYAIAHIRGGGEMGEDWRMDGRMMKKMNTFTDFIACAEDLIKQKYTSKDRLVIQGGSAGGMLMGAVTNMRPDLFHAVVAQVPFVDVINTMLDPSLPLTTSEFIEWGNPNDKPAYDYMKQYSPYDNVKATAYPNMLVKVSLNDSQVPYWEGTKLVAKLRATKTDKNLLLLKVNFGAGHSGSSGRYDALHETAFNDAFILTQMGITQ